MCWLGQRSYLGAMCNYSSRCYSMLFLCTTLYFQECLSGCLQVLLTVFKAAQLFSPQKVHEMKPECTAVDALSEFPFLHPATLGISSKNCLSMSLQQKASPQHIAPLSFGKDMLSYCQHGLQQFEKSYSPHLLHLNESSPSEQLQSSAERCTSRLHRKIYYEAVQYAYALMHATDCQHCHCPLLLCTT